MHIHDKYISGKFPTWAMGVTTNSFAIKDIHYGRQRSHPQSLSSLCEILAPNYSCDAEKST